MAVSSANLTMMLGAPVLSMMVFYDLLHCALTMTSLSASPKSSYRKFQKEFSHQLLEDDHVEG